jgi:hypothetical protein
MTYKKVYVIAWDFLIISTQTFEITDKEERQFLTADYLEYLTKVKELTHNNAHAISGIKYIENLKYYEGDLRSVPEPRTD